MARALTVLLPAEDEMSYLANSTNTGLVLGQFENLFRNLGDVNNGFPRKIPLGDLTDREQYNSEMLEANLMFGSPEVVIAKLQRYQALGVDEFIYYASMGLGQKEQKHSLELFCSEVMPAFA